VGRYRSWGSGTVENGEKRSPEDADIKPPRGFHTSLEAFLFLILDSDGSIATQGREILKISF